jgi:tetratricopeptide (TPR) repeat protein
MNGAKLTVAIVLGGLFFFLTCAPIATADDASKRKERARSHLIEARRLASAYRVDKAADKAREALQDDPSLAEAHVYIGSERFRASDWKGAESEFSKALELDPYQAAAHCQLGYVLYQQGQLESATDHWNLSVRLDATSPQTFAGLALSQFKHGEEEQAIRTFDKVLMYDRRFADAKFLTGDNGPRWSGQILQDFQELLAKVNKAQGHN